MMRTVSDRRSSRARYVARLVSRSSPAVPQVKSWSARRQQSHEALHRHRSISREPLLYDANGRRGQMGHNSRLVGDLQRVQVCPKPSSDPREQKDEPHVGIQPVNDKVFQSAATTDPSVNSNLQPAAVSELPPAPATEPKLINKVDSLAASATEHQPVAATVVLQTNMVLQPTATGALPTPVLEPRPATTNGSHSAPFPGLLLIPTKLTHSILKFPYNLALSSGHQLLQQTVIVLQPQANVDAAHQPASPWLPPVAAQGSSAPVPVSLPPAAAQGPPPGFTLRVIPVSVRGASPEANDKPTAAPDEEPSSSLAKFIIPPLGPGFQTLAAHAVRFSLTSAKRDQPSSVGEPPPGLEWEPTMASSTGAALAAALRSHPVLTSKVLSDPVGEPPPVPRRRPSATPPEGPELDPDFWALQSSPLSPPLVPACEVHPGSVGSPNLPVVENPLQL
ncbi:hypothetical protein J4Q44_G00091680 [Coregonus suidteri]|uniref:Uncharacterized protein n=1 Tax=Coregonus suidteri TaxID=861788 RepID=A0AAN8R0X0_9TELE